MNSNQYTSVRREKMDSLSACIDEWVRQIARDPFTITMVVIVGLLFVLRFRGDAVVGASFLRAFVARGSWVGIAIAITAGVVVGTVWLASSVLHLSTVMGIKVPWSSLYRLMKIAWLIGFTGNILLTLSLSYFYDEQIRSRSLWADNPLGVVLNSPDRPHLLVLRQRSDGSYEHRLPLCHVTEAAQNMLEAGEDRRHNSRAIGPDIVRLVRAPFDSTGASGIAEQLAGLMFGIYPSSETTSINRLYAKVEKTLIGIRIDDVISDRKEQVRLYLALASFGTIAGHEIVGLESAAQIFYNVKSEDLAPEQLAELIARVKSPNNMFPYQRPDESNERFSARRERLRARANWFLRQATTEGYLAETERARAELRIFNGLRTVEQVMNTVTHPRLFSIYRELRRLVPEIDSIKANVKVGFNALAQQALTDATTEGLEELNNLVGDPSGDQVMVDAVVLGPDGAIRARIGLAEVSDQMASQLKGETYAIARSDGILFSIDDEVEPGVTAATALAKSLNPPAIALGQQVGLLRLEALLQSQGFTTTGAFPFLPLGSGVSGSPVLVAAVFSKFGYRHPGSIVIQPGLISEVREAETGVVLFRPQLREIFTPEVSIDVRRALEECAVTGTAHRLAEFAGAARLNAKTGTSAFRSVQGSLEGRGGSWIVINDSANDTTIAIRVRWRTGRPFAPEGGQSAALIANHLIEKLRTLNQRSF